MNTERIVNIFKEAYFSPKPWEKNGTIYKYLGVGIFKRWVPAGDKLMRVSRHNDRPFLKKISIDSAKEYELWTRTNETVHAPLTFLATGVTIFLVIEGHYLIAGIGGIANIIANLYPTMLQRYNRARVSNLLQRRERLDKSKSFSSIKVKQ